MKRKSRRYMGMTGMQLGILAGLSVVAMCSVGGLFWVILSMSMPSDTPAIPAPIATQVSATVSPTNTLTAELTPTVTPTAVVIGTAVPPAGWIEFKIEGAAIWLPNSFVGGDMINHRGGTLETVTKLGSEFKNVADSIKNAPPEVVLWMVDKNLGVDIITSVVVRHVVSTEDTSIDQFIEDYLNSAPNGTPVTSSLIVNGTKKISLLGREARRLMYTQRIGAGGHDSPGFVYYIKDGADFWSINYSLPPNDLLTLLPIVEESITTFYLGE